MSEAIIAAAIFGAAYAVIASERVHKTIVALIAGVAIIVSGVLSQEEAFAAIDFNVIFLLASMMILAHIMRKTGAFQWVAIKSVKLAKGEPKRVLILLALLTAVASALLDNVTTVVLLVPLSLFIADSLNISPKPFLISTILVSNVGGTATLIGDPPNILIGSAANLSFTDFLLNLTPIAFLILALYLAFIPVVFAKHLIATDERKKIVMGMDEKSVITDPPLLQKSLIVMTLTMIGFLLHQSLGLEPATVALGGAALLLLWSGETPEGAFEEVEWSTLFFFIGLFIIVEGVVQVGLIDRMADMVLGLTQGHLGLSAMAVLWISALLSGVIDNIPYTAAMVPFIQRLGEQLPIVPLWWSLALGACLGGNLTIIAASANVYVVNVAKRSGHAVTFVDFLRYGIPVTFGSVALSSVYIWVRYLM